MTDFGLGDLAVGDRGARLEQYNYKPDRHLSLLERALIWHGLWPSLSEDEDETLNEQERQFIEACRVVMDRAGSHEELDGFAERFRADVARYGHGRQVQQAIVQIGKECRTALDVVQYHQMVYDVSNPWCWACGRDAAELPHDWFAPWFIQRAHLRAGGGVRDEDRRAVNLLCPLCHKLHAHRPGGTRTISGLPYPVLSDANMVWIKQHRDGDYFDGEYVRRIWIGKPPEPEAPNHWYQDEYARRRENPLSA